MMFRKYEDFDVNDFVCDPFFRKWVKEPSRETEEFWETWMRLHPEKKGIVLEARQLLTLVDFRKTSTNNIDADALLYRIRASIENSEAVTSVPVEHSAWMLSRWAAALVIVVMSGFTVYYLMRSLNPRVDRTTAYAENETVVLPDQSVVVLNANSKIEYANNWNENKVREVWLMGEAFFQVRKSPGKGNAKFIVHTDELSVEVLGTEFDVASRRGKTRVILNTGKVRLTSDHAPGREMTMKPGELAELSARNKFVKHTVNPVIYSAWKEGKFNFNRVPLKEIIQIIEDTYGYDVALEVDGISNETFTGIIPSNDPDNLLKVLSESYDVKITKSGEQLLISR